MTSHSNATGRILGVPKLSPPEYFIGFSRGWNTKEWSSFSYKKSSLTSYPCSKCRQGVSVPSSSAGTSNWFFQSTPTVCEARQPQICDVCGGSGHCKKCKGSGTCSNQACSVELACGKSHPDKHAPTMSWGKYLHACTHVYTHTNTHTNVHAHVHVHVHVHVHIHIHTHTYTLPYTYTHIRTHTYTHTHTHTYIHIRTHSYTRRHTHRHTHTETHTQRHMHLHTYVHTNTHTHRQTDRQTDR